MKNQIYLDIFTRSGKQNVTASGLLILFSLLFRHVFSYQHLSDPFLIAAAGVAGIPIVLRAVSSLGRKHISIDLLVSIAAIGAVFIAEYWEAAAVTFLFALGAYLERRTMARTRSIITELIDLSPVSAVVIRNGVQQEIDAVEVLPGETVIIKPAAKIPVDGIVMEGDSRVDESSISGESWPSHKKQGDKVFAATINQSGMLHVKATGVGEDTTLARIIHRVEEAQEAKAPTQRFMERFSRWYTPFIIVLSVVVFILSRDSGFALTVLVIGCPGALVISTPVSIVAGIGAAAREGILMKGGAHLEQSGRVNAVALDKTGTLTEGHPELSEIFIPEEAAAKMSEKDVLYWAAAAESGSEHPIAGAILRKAEEYGPIVTPDLAQAVPGKGLSAQHKGRHILVGSRRFLEEQGVVTASLISGESSAVSVFVALDGQLIGALKIQDQLRPSAAAAIAKLKKAGIKRIVMLTGDSWGPARELARSIGIDDVYAELLPEDKLRHIQSLREEGYIVAMVGDGINDTPALAAADVGVAMGASGTALAIETADISLMRNDLNLLARSLRRAHLTLGNIRVNISIALLTVAILLIGVLMGQVHMAAGMLIHEASVLLVILNGMSLLKVK